MVDFSITASGSKRGGDIIYFFNIHLRGNIFLFIYLYLFSLQELDFSFGLVHPRVSVYCVSVCLCVSSPSISGCPEEEIGRGQNWIGARGGETYIDVAHLDRSIGCGTALSMATHTRAITIEKKNNGEDRKRERETKNS